MRTVVFTFLLLCCSFFALAQQQAQTSSHYISDDLYVFMHAGPGRNYRILGSVQAGLAVTKTDKDITNDFVEIIDADGRQGWIEVEFLNSETSRRVLLERFREQLTEAQAAVTPLRQELSTQRQKNTELTSINSDLEKQIQTLQRQLSDSQDKLQENQHEEQMQTLLIGGGLVAGGALLGVIFVYLPKKRKRNDGWVN